MQRSHHALGLAADEFTGAEVAMRSIVDRSLDAAFAPSLGIAHTRLAQLAEHHGDLLAAQRHIDEAVARARATTDPRAGSGTRAVGQHPDACQRRCGKRGRTPALAAVPVIAKRGSCLAGLRRSGACSLRWSGSPGSQHPDHEREGRALSLGLVDGPSELEAEFRAVEQPGPGCP
jgi:hypothetical protein